MRLVDLCAGKDNNLNLLRALAALSVLLSHSFALSSGSPATEPLRSLIGMTPGSIAVDVFFVISGFLVTASICRSQSLIDFVAARFLRIFPGLFVMLVLSVFGLGLAMTTLSPKAYLSSSATYSYFAWCLTLFRGVKYELPGVFEANPYRLAVNGSLWTLPYEVRMYAILGGSWLLCRLLSGAYQAKLFPIICIGAACTSGAYLLTRQTQSGDGAQFIWLFFMFFTGASFFVLRKWIHLSGAALIGASAALLATSQLSVAHFGQSTYSALPILHSVLPMFPRVASAITILLAIIPTGYTSMDFPSSRRLWRPSHEYLRSRSSYSPARLPSAWRRLAGFMWKVERYA